LDVEGAMSAISEHIQASQRERLNEYDRWKRETNLSQSVPPYFDMHRLTATR